MLRSTIPAAPQLLGLRSQEQLFFLVLLETPSQELYNLKTLPHTRVLAKPPEVGRKEKMVKTKLDATTQKQYWTD